MTDEAISPIISEPEVVINILETRSQPVSILGAVHQLQGQLCEGSGILPGECE